MARTVHHRRASRPSGAVLGSSRSNVASAPHTADPRARAPRRRSPDRTTPGAATLPDAASTPRRERPSRSQRISPLRTWPRSFETRRWRRGDETPRSATDAPPRGRRGPPHPAPPRPLRTPRRDAPAPSPPRSPRPRCKPRPPARPPSHPRWPRARRDTPRSRRTKARALLRSRSSQRPSHWWSQPSRPPMQRHIPRARDQQRGRATSHEG